MQRFPPSATDRHAGTGPIRTALLCGGLVGVAVLSVGGAQRSSSQANQAIDVGVVLNRYCAGCHNERVGTAGLAFETLDVADPGAHPEIWEKVVQKLRGGMIRAPRISRRKAKKLFG